MPTANTDDLLLLHLNEAIATIRDKDQLFQIIARKLRLIFPFDMMGISIFDEELLNKRLFFKDYTTINPPEPTPANITVFTPIAGSPVEMLLEDPRIQHIELREHLRHYADFEPFQRLLRLGIQYMTMVPMAKWPPHGLPHPGYGAPARVLAGRRAATRKNNFAGGRSRAQYA
jgi:formate hydrogenlyase transcriptional activator